MTRRLRDALCKQLDLPVGATNAAILARLDVLDRALKVREMQRDDAEARLNGDELMNEAWHLTNGDRHKSYGKAEDVFRSYGFIWTGLIAHKLKPGAVIDAADVALMMTGLKIARDAQNGKRDNIVDAHGYLSLLARIRGWIRPSHNARPQRLLVSGREATHIDVDEVSRTIDVDFYAKANPEAGR